MYFTILAFCLFVDYALCQENCSQNNSQVMTTTTDLSVTSASTSYSMENSLKQATVEIQFNGLNGSAVIDLTSAADSSNIRLASLHESFNQHYSSSIDLTSMLGQSVYWTGHSSLTTGLSVPSQGSSVWPTPRANFSGYFSPKLTSLPSQLSPTITNIGIFTSSGVPSIVFDLFNVLLFGSLLIAMILAF